MLLCRVLKTLIYLKSEAVSIIKLWVLSRLLEAAFEVSRYQVGGTRLVVTAADSKTALVELLLEIYPRSTNSRTELEYTVDPLFGSLVRTALGIRQAFSLFSVSLMSGSKVFNLAES